MLTVQVLVQRESYVRALSNLLQREGVYEVVCVPTPDFERDGVIVADRMALERYPSLLQHADRLVLISPNDPQFLSLLWEFNVRSVVFESDPPSTAVLAIIGADLSKNATSGPFPVLNGRVPSPSAAPISPKRPM